MIVLDTSALVAIAFGEEDAWTFSDAIDRPGDLLIGTPTLVELRMVLTRRFGIANADAVSHRLVPFRSRVVPFDTRHQCAAEEAFAAYGKGQHPAALNFGDCMAYAIAKVAGCPLLYKGDDFARTDIRSAL